MVIQRVSRASVAVGEREIARIGTGFVVLAGFARTDTPAALQRAATQLTTLRIFADAAGKMNRSALEVRASLLVVPELTLAADVSAGRRPDFGPAMPAADAAILFEAFVALLQQSGLDVAQGQFQAQMDVTLVNDGPVTFVVDV